ncbi:MAG: hypothetical protein ABJH63_13980 [Rhizobiaceae bacterium]
MLRPVETQSRLQGVHTAIANESILSDAILDVHQQDDTLVILTAQETPETFLRLTLDKVWTGPIEVYCATALLDGADFSLN